MVSRNEVVIPDGEGKHLQAQNTVQLASKTNNKRGSNIPELGNPQPVDGLPREETFSTPVENSKETVTLPQGGTVAPENPPEPDVPMDMGKEGKLQAPVMAQGEGETREERGSVTEEPREQRQPQPTIRRRDNRDHALLTAQQAMADIRERCRNLLSNSTLQERRKERQGQPLRPWLMTYCVSERPGPSRVRPGEASQAQGSTPTSSDMEMADLAEPPEGGQNSSRATHPPPPPSQLAPHLSYASPAQGTQQGGAGRPLSAQECAKIQAEVDIIEDDAFLQVFFRDEEQKVDRWQCFVIRISYHGRDPDSFTREWVEDELLKAGLGISSRNIPTGA